MAAFGAAFLLAMMLSLWVSRNLTKPLSNGRAARQLAEGSPESAWWSPRPMRGFVGPHPESDDRPVGDKDQGSLRRSRATAGHAHRHGRRRHGAGLSGTVVQVNPALERMFALELTESRVRHHAEVIRHEGLTALVSAVFETRSGRREITLSPAAAARAWRPRSQAAIASRKPVRSSCFTTSRNCVGWKNPQRLRRQRVARAPYATDLDQGYVEALLDGGKDDPGTATAFLEIIMRQKQSPQSDSG